MNQSEIKKFLESFSDKKDRTIVIIDFGNMDKWRYSLGWKVGIQELAKLTKHLSAGKKFLRRFYYGSDYGPSENSKNLSRWSGNILSRAKINGFTNVTKRVKYIHDNTKESGYEKKCDLDVEMVVDLICEKDNYDTVVLFSGDGDLMYGINYLYMQYGKECFVFGARDHIGREVFDSQDLGSVRKILYVEDFRYRLDMDRFRY